MLNCSAGGLQILSTKCVYGFAYWFVYRFIYKLYLQIISTNPFYRFFLKSVPRFSQQIQSPYSSYISSVRILSISIGNPVHAPTSSANLTRTAHDHLRADETDSVSYISRILFSASFPEIGTLVFTHVPSSL